MIFQRVGKKSGFKTSIPVIQEVESPLRIPHLKCEILKCGFLALSSTFCFLYANQLKARLKNTLIVPYFLNMVPISGCNFPVNAFQRRELRENWTIAQCNNATKTCTNWDGKFIRRFVCFYLFMK